MQVPPVRSGIHLAAPPPREPSAQDVEPTDQVILKAHDTLRPPARQFLADFQAEMGVDEATLLERKQMMKSSPGMFFRMYPSLFVHDLQGDYRELARLGKGEAPRVMASGDCHIGNFGSLRSKDGGIVWTVNDYDQSGPGSPEVDLTRLATSIHLVGDGKMVEKMAESYRRTLKQLAATGPAAHPGLTQAEGKPPVSEFLAKMGKKTQQELLAKYSEGGKLKRNEELSDADPAITQAIAAQLPYPVLDLAVKHLSGGSSRGLDRYYALVQEPGQPLASIVEVKALLPSPLDGITGDPHKSKPADILARMERMGAPNRAWDGKLQLGDQPFLVREREREKGDIDPYTLKADQMESLCVQAGAVLAQLHARTPAQAKALLAWSESDDFVGKLRKFAKVYSQQVQEDFQAL